MTLNEFKAWLEGYEASFETIDGGPIPDGKQWAEIKAKLAKVTQPAASVLPTPQRFTWPDPHPIAKWAANRISDMERKASTKIDRAAFNEAAEA